MVGGYQCLFIYFIPCVERSKLLLKEKTSNPTEAKALFHCSESIGDEVRFQVQTVAQESNK